MQQNDPKLEISKYIFFGKDEYLEGGYLQGFTPTGQRKVAQQCIQHCWSNTTSNSDYELSNKRHKPTKHFCITEGSQKCSNPPPETVSAALAKGKDSKISSNFRVGDSVVIFSLRENRTKYNGEIGQVCAVIWPNDRERSIIYVKTGKMQPCFSESELKKAPAPQAVEEVEA